MLKDPVSVHDPARYRLVECPVGSLVLIHHAVLHKSENNRLGKASWVYMFHTIEGTARYDKKNWLQVPCTGGTNFLRLFE